MNITQRQAALVILGVPPLIGFILFPFLLIDAGPYNLTSFIINTCIGAGIFVSYWRYHWELARNIGVTFNAIQTALMLPATAFANGLPISILIPPILSLVICAPPWILINGLLALAIVYGRFGAYGGLARPDSLLIYGMLLIGLLVGRAIVETERRRAEANARLAQAHAQKSQAREERMTLTNAQLLEEIEKREKAEEQFRQAQKMEAIGRLAGGVAHDFNNLLVPIIGYTTLGLNRLTPEDKLYNHLSQIKDAAERAANLTRQILAFSRQQVLEIHTLNLNSVISNFEKMAQRLIGEDITLRTSLAPDLPLIRADQSQMEQILLNLVVNARDAMPNGGHVIVETTTVYLDEGYLSQYADALEPGHYAMLAVSDTGHGMDTATRVRIFEPFFTTKERGKGTGLGLSTVFGIVKQHGGHVWVYSELDRGTTFKIYLPLADASNTFPHTSEDDVKSLYGTETILVVEDEPAVRQLVYDALNEYGYHILTATDPHEGLQLVIDLEGKIDLILTDVIMPHMNGRELHHQISALYPLIPVLYMSGYTDDIIAHHGVLDEGTRFLQKPFSIYDLTNKVRQTLANGNR